jgi:hypothetical protein
MRNDREICGSAQKGKQVTKSRNHEAALGAIRARKKDFSDGIIGPSAAANL